jgi:hypothetical protein
MQLVGRINAAVIFAGVPVFFAGECAGWMCGEVFVHLQEQLVMPQSLFPRRYYIDDDGRRVLIGLTVEQTGEFELLELPEPSPGIDQASLNHGRWLELYRLHQQAWEIWREKSSKPDLSVAPGPSTFNRAPIWD